MFIKSSSGLLVEGCAPPLGGGAPATGSFYNPKNRIRGQFSCGMNAARFLDLNKTLKKKWENPNAKEFRTALPF